MKCIKCKKNISNDDVFCGYCGIHQEKYKKYLEKVTNKVHKDRDREYNANISNAQSKLKKLQSDREKEIKRIADERWQYIGNNSFSFNTIEGKIKINDSIYSFSEVKGAEIVQKDSFRTVTNTTSKSKKHTSLGGGALGAIVAGPVGAAVGGSVLGKTTEKGTTNSDTIPTCYHIGVDVKLGDFNTEIVLLSRTIDQNSPVYDKTIESAQKIVNKLRDLSKTPVPKTFLQPEEENSVLEIDKEIKEAEEELKKAENNKPTYEIPESYLK